MWPALAFILGMFPQRGLSWLRERVPVFSAQAHASVRKLPLEMIEGVSMHDRLRLEEHGLDNCFDLATTDFVPLAVSTPYSARTLVDWILQAKLCVYCGEAVGDLRLIGIRTILDLEHLQHDELEMLAKETAATKSALESAKYSLDRDHEMRRLRKIAHLLGLFATSPDVVEGPSEPGSNVWHAAAPGQRADLASEAPMSVAGNRVQPGAQAGPAGSNPGVDPE
jgi:hypothetical protein